MSWTAPPDPRVWHGYSDAPRHTVLVVLGWFFAGLFAAVGCLGVLMLAVPSDPCAPEAVECGPEPRTFALVGLGLWVLAGVAAAWAVYWLVRDARYRFQAPPNWPPHPPGWRPARGWMPPAEFPKAPEGWKFWR